MKVIEQPFQEEIAAYIGHSAELLRDNEDKFVAFRGSEFLGIFDTFKAAYAAGLKQWGNVPMFIKKLEKEERVDEFPSLDSGTTNADL